MNKMKRPVRMGEYNNQSFARPPAKNIFGKEIESDYNINGVYIS